MGWLLLLYLFAKRTPAAPGTALQDGTLGTATVRGSKEQVSVRFVAALGWVPREPRSFPLGTVADVASVESGRSVVRIATWRGSSFTR